jgi:F-type H+-transporting ATPase subunit b
MTTLLLASIADDLLNTAKTVGETFGFKPQLFFSQVVSFLIVAGLLYLFAYKPVLGVLAERRKNIEDGLAAAQRMRDELANAEQKVQSLLREAGDKADAIIADARTSAESLASRKSQEAIVEAQRIIESARAASRLEVDQIKAEIKRDFGRLIVETTARVTGKVLTAEDHQRLEEEAARELTRA